MVGTYRQHLACVAAQLNGVKRHRSMKPSSRDPQLGLASPLNYAANQSGNIKSPSKKEAGLDVSHQALVSREGRGENFFLTSSLIGRAKLIATSVARLYQWCAIQTASSLLISRPCYSLALSLGKR